MPRLRLAQFLAERGRAAEAEEHFQKLLRLTPNHPLASLGLARLRQTQNRLAECTNSLSACLNDPHTAKSGHALLAAVQQSLGNAEAAAAAARRNAGLPPEVPWPDPYWAEAAAFRVGKKAWLEDASALIDEGRVDEGARVLGMVTREYPEDDEAWYLLGWAFNQRQDGAGAEQALREHLRRSPRSPKGHAQLGAALLHQKRYAEAIEMLQAGLKLKPTWRELHFNLGFAQVQLGRYEEAMHHFRQTVLHDPNYVPGYTALGDLLSRRGENDEARRLLQQALTLDPSDARARSLLQRVGQAQ